MYINIICDKKTYFVILDVSDYGDYDYQKGLVFMELSVFIACIMGFICFCIALCAAVMIGYLKWKTYGDDKDEDEDQSVTDEV